MKHELYEDELEIRRLDMTNEALEQFEQDDVDIGDLEDDEYNPENIMEEIGDIPDDEDIVSEECIEDGQCTEDEEFIRELNAIDADYANDELVPVNATDDIVMTNE